MSTTKPYYERNGIKIYHSDALSFMREGAFPKLDAVAMDPPYASGAATEAGRASRTGGMLRGPLGEEPIANDTLTTTGFTWMMRELLLGLRPHVRAGGSVLRFTDWRQWATVVGIAETCSLRVNAMVVWDKKHMGLGTGFRKRHELILSASVGSPDTADKGVPDVLDEHAFDTFDLGVIQVSRGLTRGIPHPSPKPVGLMQKLLQPTTRPGGVVIDPFMGSGATLAAAAWLGRKAIGVESQESYCELAARRLEHLFARGVPT